MGCCAAPNCSSNSSKGIRLFRFPAQKDRRAKWLQNCRRDKWEPSTHSKLCELHFEESQFELKRADGRRLLKWNAIPTKFDVPNPPKPISFKRKYPKERIVTKAESNKDTEVFEEETCELQQETCSTADNSIANLKMQNKRLKAEMRKMKEKMAASENKLKTFLHPDQMKYLERASESNPYKWSNETIRFALKVKCAVGTKGYEFLRNTNYPLPSARTLRRRIEACKFAPGIQHDIIEWLGVKLQSEDLQGKLCVLSLDEMSIRPFVEYDKGLKRYIGFVSEELSSSSELQLATHVLVFVVRGLTVHWKQVVAYFLTGNSTDPNKLWNTLKKVIECLCNQGIVVKCVSSDMGASNVGMWGILGIHSIRSQVNCKIKHPFLPEENLYFAADVPHILKNIRNCLLSQNILLSEVTVKENTLSHNTVSLMHVESLIKLQGEGGPVLVPSLSATEINPSTFEKMRVPVARNLLNRCVASALQFAALVGLIPKEALTTSWFINNVSMWYEIMVSRKKVESLCRNNADKIMHLRQMLQWFTTLSFSSKKQWKPIQSGLQLTTTTALELFDELCSRQLIDYLLTSRLSTDCVENFFSQVRETGDIHPTPVKLRHVIRMISIAQYSHVPRSSSYEVDDDEYYLDFFSKSKQPEAETEAGLEPQASDPVNINIVQLAGLYYLSGWVVHKLIRASQSVTCDTCIKSIYSPQPPENLPHEWTSTVNQGALMHPTEAAYSVIHHGEQVFQKCSFELLKYENVPHHLLTTSIRSMECGNCPFCPEHDVVELLLKTFFSVRLHIFAKDLNTRFSNKSKNYASKSSFMRTSADVQK